MLLDTAGGTGDIAFAVLQNHESQHHFLGDKSSGTSFPALLIPALQVVVSDINESMLKLGALKAKRLGLKEESKPSQ